ncbi:condensin-2 complex subunit H2 [Oryzias latipes]|nr:condensin-2 complex subunit H2 [Oryzias latipes]
MESTESRFAHLLQPIRELTKNWDVDVASQLNDYLDELDEMCITFDGGKTRLNFAEAALLIQGSACIYSKKVELLHHLVFQTLEFISEKNKKRSQEAETEKSGGSRMTSNRDDDGQDMFSPLDLDQSQNWHQSGLSTTVVVTPLPPESLIPPESQEKQKLPLISVKGEVLCSQRDFRINLFFPGEGGVVLLRLRSALELDLHPANFLHQDSSVDASMGADVPPEAGEDCRPEDRSDQDPEQHVDRHQAGSGVREKRQIFAEERPQQDAPPPVNVWTLHDPYAVLAHDKPFRMGRCYRVPHGLDEGGKRKRRCPCPLQDFRSWFRGTSGPMENKLKGGPTFTDLNYIYLKSLKDKIRTRRRLNRRVGLVMSEDELRRTLLQPQEVGLQQEGDEPADAFRDADMFGEHDLSEEESPEDPADFAGGAQHIADQADELSYEDLVKLQVEQLVAHSRGYIQESALSRRVKDWEDHIGPELLLQEQRPPFSIREYGDRITGALSGVGCCRTFSSLVQGQDNLEVCKFLLASLQLANDYTVEIQSSAGLEESLDTMSLTLLSTHRATDRFQNLQASS